MGRLLADHHDFAGARSLHERALSIREKVLGPDHPDTATSLNSLAILLRAQGELAGARELYERALAIYEKTLGPDHPNVATCLNNVALILFEDTPMYAGAQAWVLREHTRHRRKPAAFQPGGDIAQDALDLADIADNLPGDVAMARPQSLHGFYYGLLCSAPSLASYLRSTAKQFS